MTHMRTLQVNICGCRCSVTDFFAKVRKENQAVVLARAWSARRLSRIAPKLRYVAGTKRKNHVARLRLLANQLDSRVERRCVRYLAWTVLRNALGQHLAGYARNRRFAGSIDVQQHKRIRILERGRKLLHQQLRAAVTMRLKNDVYALESALAGGGERRPDLSWMVAIVIDHSDTVRAPLGLKAAIHTVELLQGFADAVDRNVQSHSHGHGGGCIEHVVRARHAQAKLSQVGATIVNTEAAQRKAFPIAGSEAAIGDAEVCALAAMP